MNVGSTFRVRARHLAVTSALCCIAAWTVAAGLAFAKESGRRWASYRDPSEVVVTDPAVVELVYETALRFYRPPRNQSRWLDPRLLPAARGDSAAGSLDASLATRLVARLGDRFCVLGSDGCDPDELGGELRVSPIYSEADGRMRVIVACRMVWPTGPTTDNGAQAFLIERTKRGWRIADRGGVETPD
jgi:hypothetical protein